MPFEAPTPATATKKTGGQWRGGGGKSDFDPRATEKDFLMAAMNSATTAGVALQLQQELGQLPKDADIPALFEELRERFYQALIEKRKDMERPATGSTTAGTTSGQQVAAQTGGSVIAEYPSEWDAFPNASLAWPMGKFGAEKNGGTALTLAQALSKDPAYFRWYATTPVKQSQFVDFQRKVIDFMNAAEAAGVEFPERGGS